MSTTQGCLRTDKERRKKGRKGGKYSFIRTTGWKERKKEGKKSFLYSNYWNDEKEGRTEIVLLLEQQKGRKDRNCSFTPVTGRKEGGGK